MHRTFPFLAAVLVLLLVGLGAVAPAGSAQDTATPSSATPAAATPAPVCSQEEILNGEDAGFLPAGVTEGIVQPEWMEGEEEYLYIAVLTLPPDSCRPFRHRDGALVLFVQQGTVVYTAQVYNDAAVEITKGDSDGSGGDNIAVAPGHPITLHAGDWITQDREVWFSFRNSGSDDAIVSAAVFAPPPSDDERCNGGCRGRP